VRGHLTDIDIEDSERTFQTGHPHAGGTDTARAIFSRALRQALNHLYDPGTLRRSPLIHFFDLDQRTNSVSALQTILNDAIEALKPDSTVPTESNAWRIYHILYYRHTEQSPQREVANDLALSVRQLRRQERVALEVLAGHLWGRYYSEDKALALALSSQNGSKSTSPKKRTPSREQELAWFEESEPSRPTNAREVIDGVLDIIHQLVEDLEVSLISDVPDELPLMTARPTALRQGLFYVLTLAARRVPGGRVTLTMRTTRRRTHIHIQVAAQRATPSPKEQKDAEDLKMAYRLIEISGGRLEAESGTNGLAPFHADILLPTTEQVPVLVVDDNMDTLHLIERYLADSRYRFVGTADPHKVLMLVEQTTPSVVVLDIMLPEVDGWELLGRLREHPKLRDVPIIVCTILSQEQLALTVGAASFLRKPISREGLLSALDQQIAPALQELHQPT